MLFEIYGRFRLEILREADGWCAYRIEPGKRMKLPELAIPASLNAEEVAQYLDDLYHEMATPGQVVRRITCQMTSSTWHEAQGATHPLKFRAIAADDVPALFHVRTRTRENTMTLEQLQRLGINPQTVTESLGKSTKGWVCDDAGQIVAFSMADRDTGEFLVIAVLPEYEGMGVGGRLMSLAEEWLAASGCKRAWLTTDLDTSLRAYGFYRKRGWTDWKIERGLRWMELSFPP